MRLVALLGMLAAMAAWLPATVLAQSAGDDQYVDPFQDDEPGSGNQGGGGGNQGGGDDTPAAEEPVAQAPADTGDTAGVEAAQDGSGLPNTGLAVGGLALIGVILLGGGYALRRAWPRHQ